MLSTSIRFNMRNILRFALLAALVIHLLDTEVEAGKSRKKGNKHRRTKRTHGAKERKQDRRRAGKEEIDMDTSPSLVRLVKAQQKLSGHKTKVEPEVMKDIYSQYQSSLIRKYIEERLRNKVQIVDERVTMLPVVHASLNFLVKKSPYFYDANATTIGGVDPASLGLVSLHTARGKYGLHSPSDHVFGRIIHITDAGRKNSHFGCGNAIENLHEIPRNGQPWIALIERGHCAFFIKIKLAERNNASAVIIYDSKQEEIPKMNTLGTKIVSVAISKHDGHKIIRLTEKGTKVIVNIDVNTNPNIPTKPDITTSATPPYQLDRSVQENPGENGANTNRAVFVITVLTALLSSLLQNMTL